MLEGMQVIQIESDWLPGVDLDPPEDSRLVFENLNALRLGFAKLDSDTVIWYQLQFIDFTPVKRADVYAALTTSFGITVHNKVQPKVLMNAVVLADHLTRLDCFVALPATQARPADRVMPEKATKTLADTLPIQPTWEERYEHSQKELRLSREQYQELIDSSNAAIKYEQQQITELTEAVKRRDAAINRAREEAAYFSMQAATEYLVMLPNGRWEICHLVYDEQARYGAAWADRNGSICLSAADEPQVERLP